MCIESLHPLHIPTNSKTAHTMTRLLLLVLLTLGLDQPLAAQQNWPFTPVGTPKVPAVSDASWCRNPIDRFILAKLESARLGPSAPASREILLRRVYFDLIGLPVSYTHLTLPTICSV